MRNLLRRIGNFLFTEVPSEVAACEFDCRKTECLTEEFVICTKRLQKVEACRELAKEDLALHNPENN